jgi:hypothetical protein
VKPKITYRKKVLFSGECDNKFRIRICGIENLFQIFIQALFEEACNNGEETPIYVTWKPNLKKLQKRKTLNLMDDESPYES